MKRLLSLTALLLLAVTSFAHDFEVDGIYYDITSGASADLTVGVNYRGTLYNSYTDEYTGSVTIPRTVTYSGKTYRVESIRGDAFRGCSGLTSINIPSSVIRISSSAFEGCSGLLSVTLNSNTIASKHYSLYSSLRDVFGSQVKTYILGDDVTCIGYAAFSRCFGLTSVTIGNSVTSINSSAFAWCSGLTSIKVNAENSKYDSRDNCNAIIETSTNTLITGCKTTTIPPGVTSIGLDAFYGCSGLTNITIPNSVTSIGLDAFYGTAWYDNQPDGLVYAGKVAYKYKGTMPSGTSITLEESTTGIADYAFWYCSGLTSITIPESVTSIGENAFDDCTGLKSITLPSSVTSIGSSAFSEIKKILTKSGTKTHFNLLKEGYTNVYDIESEKYIVPYLSSTSTQTTLQISLVNRISEFVYTYGGKQITSDIVGTVTGLRPDDSRSIYVQVSFDGQSYTMEKTFYTSSISPSVSSNATSASSLQATGSYIIGDATVTKNVIKCNGKEVEGKSISVNGLNPNTSYDVEYTITVAYGDNNQSTYSYTGTKTVKTQELTLTTEQPKVVSMGNVIVSATTNVDEEEKNVGFEWRRTDWTSDFASNSGSAVIYDNTMEGYIRNLNTDKLWTYRAYYLSDAGVYYYGDWVGLDPSNTSYFEPTVHTYADISTSGKVAIIRGYVLNGTDKISVQGFKYWKKANTSNSLNLDIENESQASITSIPADAMTEIVAKVGSGQQMMNATLNNLDYGSTYEYVAFATTTEDETFYGEVKTFNTEADPTGIEGVKEETNNKPVIIVACYDINGKQISQPQKGLNILKMSDGTTRKVVK